MPRNHSSSFSIDYVFCTIIFPSALDTCSLSFVLVLLSRCLYQVHRLLLNRRLINISIFQSFTHHNHRFPYFYESLLTFSFFLPLPISGSTSGDHNFGTLASNGARSSFSPCDSSKSKAISLFSFVFVLISNFTHGPLFSFPSAITFHRPLLPLFSLFFDPNRMFKCFVLFYISGTFLPPFAF